MNSLTQWIPTAERTSLISCNNYVYMRSLKAYEMLPREISGQVLEIGSGTGYGLPYISNNADMVISIDKTQQIPLQTLNELGNVIFVKHTLPHMKCFPSGQFDYVVCYQFIEHIVDDSLLLSEITRVLKPDGKLFISTPNAKMTLSRNPWHVREYLPLEFENIIHTSGLKVEKSLGVFGNEMVMTYYEQNRQNLEKWRKYDVFNIEKLSNATIWRWAYNGLNHLNRLLLDFRKDSVNYEITVNDFSLAPVSEIALDLLYVCRKPL